MRKIEQEMMQALENRKEWQKDNTAVYYWKHGDRSECMRVDLHGNNIATIWHGSGTVEPNLYTLAKYPTNTTLSRLRALGVDVTVRKGQVFVDGVHICDR